MRVALSKLPGELPVSGRVTGLAKFSGAVTTASGLVVFAPHGADCVGTFNPVTSDFNCIDVSVDG